MSRADITRRRLKHARKDRTVALQYGGVTSDGLKGGISEQAQWQVNNYRSQYNFSVWVEADAFSSTPISSKAITVDGVTHRILGVWPDSITAAIRIDLGDRYART